jgi:hypothetical protein
MCEEFEKNRRVLAEMIYSQEGDFTEYQIAQEYKKKTGRLIVDANRSVSAYLRDLRDLGSLSLQAGKYHVIRQ